VQQCLCDRCESTPDKFDWRFNVWVNASLHRAGMSCVFQPLLILWRGFHRDSDRHRQARDSSRGRAAHLFLNRCRRSAEVDIQASCKDAHGGQHAGAERRGCKVRRREALSPALVVDWRVGSQFGLRRRMHRGTVEVALVLRLNANHIASIFALKLQKDEPRGRRRQPSCGEGVPHDSVRTTIWL